MDAAEGAPLEGEETVTSEPGTRDRDEAAEERTPALRGEEARRGGAILSASVTQSRDDKSAVDELFRPAERRVVGQAPRQSSSGKPSFENKFPLVEAQSQGFSKDI